MWVFFLLLFNPVHFNDVCELWIQCCGTNWTIEWLITWFIRWPFLWRWWWLGNICFWLFAFYWCFFLCKSLGFPLSCERYLVYDVWLMWSVLRYFITNFVEFKYPIKQKFVYKGDFGNCLCLDFQAVKSFPSWAIKLNRNLFVIKYSMKPYIFFVCNLNHSIRVAYKIRLKDSHRGRSIIFLRWVFFRNEF